MYCCSVYIETQQVKLICYTINTDHLFIKLCWESLGPGGDFTLPYVSVLTMLLPWDAPFMNVCVNG